MRTKRALALAMAIGFLGVGAATSAAQESDRAARQQQVMQQQMLQLNQVMEQTSRIQQRAQSMEREMAQLMERLHQNQMLAARNPDLLRNQERIRSMAQAMGDGAQEMHRAMEQLRNMLGDPAVVGDREMQREMERLHEHWTEMAGKMEEGLQIMDQLRDRLRTFESR